jgi:3-hydroxybutyryl-CoA dehydrogenase
MNPIQNVTVIGAGTMGNGIAQVFAQHGLDVIICDINREAINRGMETIKTNLNRMLKKELITEADIVATLERVSSQTDLNVAVSSAGLVVEAATENMELKLKIFKQIDDAAPSKAILASNTSSISITKIASVTARPSQVIGMHFMNPVPVMKLVEVIRGYATSDDTTQTIMGLSKNLNKIPVEVNDYPGFVANRILMPMINESIYTLYEGVAGVDDIDTVMKLGMSHPMGPLQLADFIGLDVCLAILEIMNKGFGNPKYAPCPLLVNMVASGRLGRKSGEGFYRYEAGSREVVVSGKFSKA